ncbi:hypothetical protein OAD62_06645 [Oceanihabitans sp.]|nr:hypothetical protein [Oceanihabitans sp.]
MRRLKLIWDFRGPNAEKTAAHHEIHLKEYIANQTAEVFKTAHEVLNEYHTITYIVVKEGDMKLFRDQLKPHRGEWLDN